MGLIEKLNAIGDAIREKNGTTDLIPLSDMPQAIRNIIGVGVRIEYIESTGSQYIDTGIIPTNHRVKMKFEKTTSENGSVLGSYGDATPDNTNVYEFVWYNGKWYFAPKSSKYQGWQGSFYPNTNYYPTEVIELDFNTYDKKILMNGFYVADTYGSSTAVMPMYLFTQSGNVMPCPMKLWYAQIYNRATEELVRDFVPAVDENGVVCLYDNITKAYFYNQGDGEFTGGCNIVLGGGKNDR